MPLLSPNNKLVFALSAKIGALIFVVEFALMAIFAILPGMPAAVETLLDSTLLTLIVSPLIYWIIIAPYVQRVYQKECELIDARNAADAANAAKSAFLANMSHEIRTPLNGVLGMADLLMETALTGEQSSYVRNISYSGETLLSIINDILDLSKIEAGHMEFESRKFAIEEVFESVMAVLTPRAQGKGIKLDLNLSAADSFEYIGDSHRIRQILYNLIGNAIKFTSQGSVVVTVTLIPSGLRIDVRDTGIGIPDEARQSLFNNFVQVDSSTSRQFGGNGLGLVICRKLVEGLGGTIGVESEYGKGSCFWFALPLKVIEKAPQEVRAPAASAEDNASHAKTESAALPLLLVEDHPVNQKLALTLLERLGYSAELAADGQQAVDAALQKQYALILMDLQMPVMNGFDAAMKIRSGGGPNSQTPIIALTANAMQTDKNACLQAGMNDFLTKPFNKKNLADRISAHLKTAPPEAAPST